MARRTKPKKHRLPHLDHACKAFEFEDFQEKKNSYLLMLFVQDITNQDFQFFAEGK